MDNPYSPPNAELVPPGERGTPWHLHVGAGLLLAWGAWGAGTTVVGLAAIGAQGTPLWFFYAALMPPLLSLLGAYGLWQRRMWAFAPVALAPVLALGTYLLISRAPPVSFATTLFGHVLERLPPQQLLLLALFGAVLLHMAFLRKWGYLR